MSSESLEKNKIIAEVFGKLVAGALLEKAQKSNTGIQQTISRFKRYCGDEDGTLTKKFFEQLPDLHKVWVRGLIEKVAFGNLSKETEKQLAGLPAEFRMVSELVLMKMTGQGINETTDRWDPEIWRFKGMFEKYIDLSPSKITREECAEALISISEYALPEILKYLIKQL